MKNVPEERTRREYYCCWCTRMQQPRRQWRESKLSVVVRSTHHGLVPLGMNPTKNTRIFEGWLWGAGKVCAAETMLYGLLVTEYLEQSRATAVACTNFKTLTCSPLSRSQPKDTRLVVFVAKNSPDEHNTTWTKTRKQERRIQQHQIRNRGYRRTTCTCTSGKWSFCRE